MFSQSGGLELCDLLLDFCPALHKGYIEDTISDP